MQYCGEAVVDWQSPHETEEQETQEQQDMDKVCVCVCVCMSIFFAVCMSILCVLMLLCNWHRDVVLLFSGCIYTTHTHTHHTHRTRRQVYAQ